MLQRFDTELLKRGFLDQSWRFLGLIVQGFVILETYLHFFNACEVWENFYGFS